MSYAETAQELHVTNFLLLSSFDDSVDGKVSGSWRMTATGKD
jgi:hypothetical protein